MAKKTSVTCLGELDFYDRPKVYIIGRPAFDADEFARFIADNKTTWDQNVSSPGDLNVSAAELLAEVSGRICYFSYGEKQRRSNKTARVFVRNIIAKGHDSVLEHMCWTIVFDRVSRSFSHQLIRHRVGWSFSQLSQQYYEERPGAFVVPSSINSDPPLRKKFVDATSRAYEVYVTLLKEISLESQSRNDWEQTEVARLRRTQARSILPNSVCTKLVGTANARALRHFLKQRGAIGGDREMRDVCVELLTLLRKEAPSVFGDFLIVDSPHGGGEVVLNSSAQT